MSDQILKTDLIDQAIALAKSGAGELKPLASGHYIVYPKEAGQVIMIKKPIESIDKRGIFEGIVSSLGLMIAVVRPREIYEAEFRLDDGNYMRQIEAVFDVLGIEHERLVGGTHLTLKDNTQLQIGADIISGIKPALMKALAEAHDLADCVGDAAVDEWYAKTLALYTTRRPVCEFCQRQIPSDAGMVHGTSSVICTDCYAEAKAESDAVSATFKELKEQHSKEFKALVAEQKNSM